MKVNLPNFAVIIPLMNGGQNWHRAAKSITIQSITPSKVLTIDSESADGSDRVAVDAGFEVHKISKSQFDHGGTRQWAAKILEDNNILVFMTQDAILADTESLFHIVKVFNNEQVGAAYGRQLPRKGAGPIEAHSRLFNYPPESEFRTLRDTTHLGLKAAFASNSFAAYRTKALFEVGGFPNKLILSEDMVVFARMLTAGWSVAYVADACVYHSHDYTLSQEFKRYFDIGVFHRNQHWILEQFGKPEGEGFQFVRYEQAYLRKRAPWLIPSSVVRTLAKYIGYKLGQQYHNIPPKWRRKISMNPRYWSK